MTNHAGGNAGSDDASHWSLVEAAVSPDAELRDLAISQLLDHYLPGLRAYLIFQMQIDRGSVDDLLQDFVADKVLASELLRVADRGKGKFSTFLRTALRNFVLDTWRRRQAAKRSPDRAVGLADHLAEALGSRPDERPDLDDVAHAWRVLIETMNRFRDQCAADGRPELWEVFAARVLKPAAVGAAPEQMARLMRRHSLTSKSQVSNLMVTAQRRMSGLLREVLSQYTPTEQLAQEMERLHRLLMAAGGWKEVLVHLAAPDAEAWMSVVEPGYSLEQLSNLLDFARGGKVASSNAHAEIVGTLLSTPLDRLFRGKPPTDLRLTDVLFGPSGTSEMLSQIKTLAKGPMHTEGGAIPQEIRTWLYYASIMAAAVHHQERISMLPPAGLVEGLDWLLGQSWIDGASRVLFETARRDLAAEIDRAGSDSRE